MFGGSFTEILSSGGYTMFLLIGCSILILAVIFDRLRAFAGTGEKASLKLTSGVIAAIGTGDFSEAGAACEKAKTPLSVVIKTGLEKSEPGISRDELEEALGLEAQRQIMHLERMLGILGTIGSIAPFIGLFGTVLGIINAFKALSTAGASGPAVVSAGIAEALVCTAAGLFVAVPAVIFFNYFSNKSRRVAAVMEESISGFILALKKSGKLR